MIANAITCPCCHQPVEDVSFLADPHTLTVTNGTFTAKLTPTAFRVARFLIDRFPSMVTKEAIYDTCFLAPNGDGPEIKIVDVYICKIRPPLAEIGLVIETVWGRGYKLVEEDATKANAIKDASIRLRELGAAHRWTPAHDEQLLELMKRRVKPTVCASIMKLPYMAVERNMKRLESQIC